MPAEGMAGRAGRAGKNAPGTLEYFDSMVIEMGPGVNGRCPWEVSDFWRFPGTRMREALRSKGFALRGPSCPTGEVFRPHGARRHAAAAPRAADPAGGAEGRGELANIGTRTHDRRRNMCRGRLSSGRFLKEGRVLCLLLQGRQKEQMLPRRAGWALDAGHGAGMEQAVQDGGGHDRLARELLPFGEFPAGREDGGAGHTAM